MARLRAYRKNIQNTDKKSFLQRMRLCVCVVYGNLKLEENKSELCSPTPRHHLVFAMPCHTNTCRGAEIIASLYRYRRERNRLKNIKCKNAKNAQ